MEYIEGPSPDTHTRSACKTVGISVIVPVFNEFGNIRRCIEEVLSEGGGPEIIVSDGGSTDGGPDVVRGYRDNGVTLIRTKKGRGPQMNAGASAAKGDVLLFLHSDTRLEPGWYGAVMTAIDDPAVAGGAFSLHIDSPAKKYRLVESWVKFRCRFFSLPYGDQAIFMKRDVFEKIGGYKDIPLMEDVDIVGRLKEAGRMAILHNNAVTDARRWEKEGWLYTSIRNQMIMLMYRLGADPRRLAGIYYR
jgi:rSAM/selenodomain-associated transferase 2